MSRAPGRRLLTDAEASGLAFLGPEAARRRVVLRETLEAFERADPPDRFHRLAEANLSRWRSKAVQPSGPGRVEVHSGDWGDVTSRLTKKYGIRFAVLNMANPFVPGGGYVEGMAAQEENMFRRTDCHFSVGSDDYDEDGGRYRPEMTKLLCASQGAVYLDLERPRVCLRGPEDRQRDDLGYAWLEETEVFSFFELRAAAQDLSDGSPFDAEEARRRIAAQLDTLCTAGLRAAVLGAFGCGAFANPGDRVARLYREEIEKRREQFDVVAFAVFDAGYGPNNYELFREAFD